ncbi:Small GTPase like protein, partial [Aduncisulcus paluster]
LGNSGVGKTCVLERYQSDRFFSTFGSTAGVETYIRKEKMDGKDVTITFYDSGGQEKFRAIVRSYYRKSRGAVLVYDITDRKSFLDLDYWVSEMQAHCEFSLSEMPIMVLGNKSDHGHLRTVPTAEAEVWCERHGFAFLETSALTGKNTSDAFKLFIQLIQKMVVKPLEDQEEDSSDSFLTRETEGLPLKSVSKKGACGR